MRLKPALIVAGLLAAMPMLGACTDFDMDKLDFFHLNEKKKLPGDRKPLFPEGVPGVTQGIPQELTKGYKPPAEAEPAKVAEPEPAKPKPKVARRPAAKPAQVTVQPAQQQQQQVQQQTQQTQQTQQPAWPDPKPQASGANAPWPAPAKQSSPWPDAPAPNTFQR